MKYSDIKDRLYHLEAISNSEIKKEGCFVTNMKGEVISEGFRTKHGKKEIFAEQLALADIFTSEEVKMYCTTFPSKFVTEMIAQYNVKEIYFKDKTTSFQRYAAELIELGIDLYTIHNDRVISVRFMKK